MALLRAVNAAFDRIAPLKLAGAWDNVGSLVDVSPYTSTSQNTVLLCIDLTGEVVDNKPESTGVIVAYHPAIFSGLKKLSHTVPLQDNILRCIRDNVSIFSPHSALDGSIGGINDYAAKAFGKGKSKRLTDRPNIPSGLEGETGAGEGLLHELDESITVEEYVQSVKKHLQLDSVILARGRGPNKRERIKRIAICAGSGGSMLSGVDCDAWLTGEASHHEYLAAVAEGKHVLMCTHTGNERFYLPILQKNLQQALTDIYKSDENFGLESLPKVVVSEACTNPLSFE